MINAELTENISRASEATSNPELNHQLVRCLDLTSLNNHDTDADIIQLCHNAKTAVGNVAAVCVYPQFVALAKEHCVNTDIKIATVINFPSGNELLEKVLADTESSLTAGADEIDLVFAYQTYLTGKKIDAIEMVKQVRKLCGEKKLKVILETGALDADAIATISADCIDAGADFLKTSTGKINQGATLGAVAIMLNAINEKQADMPRTLGVKVSGGVSSADIATQYYALAQNIIDHEWPRAETFRIGASSLLSKLL